jgi:Protein of unknown function (DUF429)
VTAGKKRILGVDFSGASDAGRKIWIAEGRVSSAGALTLIDLTPACELQGGGTAPEIAISALARHIVREPGTVVGCDFPFTLPRRLIEEPSWVDFVAAFPKRFGDPDAFRAWALRKAGGRELRRDADRAASTPFNSYNLRIYRQTWWGIAHLLHPLIAAGAAIAIPYQSRARKPLPTFIEACPACALKAIALYRPYKGRTDAHRRQRRVLLDRLVADGFLDAPALTISQRLIDDPGGDAIDATLAALVAAAAELAPKAPVDAIEGEIYWKLRGISA